MDITDIYINGSYIKKNPSLHEEDTQWKIGKLIPFIDQFMTINPEI
jgi:hypothetical protein